MKISKEIIDLNNFSTGLYFLSLKNKDHINTFKIVKE